MLLRRAFIEKTTGEKVLVNDTNEDLCLFVWRQDNASTDWVVQHNNDSSLVIMQIYQNDVLIDPDEVIINNTNSFTVKFSEAITGVVNFILSPSIEGCFPFTATPTPVASPTPTSTPTNTPPPSNTPSSTPTVTPDPTPTVTITPTSSG